jgi:hypothetical protein
MLSQMSIHFCDGAAIGSLNKVVFVNYSPHHFLHKAFLTREKRPDFPKKAAEYARNAGNSRAAAAVRRLRNKLTSTLY